MSKYSKKFKLEIIKYYLKENQSYSKCCKISIYKVKQLLELGLINIKCMGLKEYIRVQKPKRRYNSYKGTLGKIADNILKRNFKTNLMKNELQI